MLRCVLSWYVGGWVIRMDISAEDFACAKDDDCPRQQAVRDDIVRRYLEQCQAVYQDVPPAVWTRSRNCPFTVVADRRRARLYQPPPATDSDRLIVVLSWYGDWVVRLNIQSALYRQATDSTDPARDAARGRIMEAYRGRCDKDYSSVPPAWWSDEPDSRFTIVPVARPRPRRRTTKKR